MKTIETTSDMQANTPDNEGVTYASSKDQEPPPKEHYFYAYKYSTKGSWFSTMLYDTPEKAKESLDETGIIRTKLCCVVL